MIILALKIFSYSLPSIYLMRFLFLWNKLVKNIILNNVLQFHSQEVTVMILIDNYNKSAIFVYFLKLFFMVSERWPNSENNNKR